MHDHRLSGYPGHAPHPPVSPKVEQNDRTLILFQHYRFLKIYQFAAFEGSTSDFTFLTENAANTTMLWSF
jgi:hypothetical protein